MKKILIATSLCAFLAAPAFAQDKKEGENGKAEEVKPPSAEQVTKALKTLDGLIGDDAKIKGYCAITKEMEGLGDNDEKKAEEIGKKMDDYLTKLGEDVLEAFAVAESVDPESDDGKKIDATFGKIEEKCSK